MVCGLLKNNCCFGCKSRLFLILPTDNVDEQKNSMCEYLKILDDDKGDVTITTNFWLQHREKSIDNHFGRNNSNDNEKFDFYFTMMCRIFSFRVLFILHVLIKKSCNVFLTFCVNFSWIFYTCFPKETMWRVKTHLLLNKI